MYTDIIKDIKRKLRLHMNAVIASYMRESGIKYKINFGLNALSLKEISSGYCKSSELAELLWKENIRECKILATMLYPYEEFTPEKADRFLNECITYELIEQLCFNTLQHCPFAEKKAVEWIKADDEKTVGAGFMLLTRLMLNKKKISDIDNIIAIAEKNKNSDNFFISVNIKKLMDKLGHE